MLLRAHYKRAAEPLNAGRSGLGFGVDQSGQEEMTEAVETEGVEIIVGKVELESAAEILDALLEVVPAQVGQ
jgi:hypothetical protein